MQSAFQANFAASGLDCCIKGIQPKSLSLILLDKITMDDRAFETTIDSQGHFDIPIDVRDRHGLTNGARVKIEERGNEVIVSHIEIEDISDLAGILTKGDPVGDVLRERALDREREDAKFRF